MKIPNSNQAVVDIQKLRDYCLSMEHPRGRHKARVFASAPGFTADDAEKLQAILLDRVSSQDNALPGEQDEYGQRYTLDFNITGLNGKQASVRSGWIILSGENFPRLTTCYVL